MAKTRRRSRLGSQLRALRQGEHLPHAISSQASAAISHQIDRAEFCARQARLIS